MAFYLIILSAKKDFCKKNKKSLAFFNEVVYSVAIEGKYDDKDKGVLI